MKTYRVTYNGYLEDDFESEEDAVNAFLDMLDWDASDHIEVEVWNEEEGEWELT